MDNAFSKYSSIENHYQSKFIDSFVSQNPQLLGFQYVLEEKIHGANFQILITSDSVAYGSRTKYLEEGDKLYNYRSVIEREDIKDMVTKTQEIIQMDSTSSVPLTTVTMYGELYGKGVQGEIYYKDHQDFAVFDIKLNETYATPEGVRVFLDDVDSLEKAVPIVAVCYGLEDALNFDVIFDSILGGKPDNKAEGVVIKPEVPIFRSDGKRFIIKKKNPLYLENKAGKVKKPKTPIVYTEIQLAFFEYINDNRVAGVMSKYGEIMESKDIGKYIKYIFLDAVEDFQKENEQYEELDILDVKSLMKVSSKWIVQLIQKFL